MTSHKIGYRRCLSKPTMTMYNVWLHSEEIASFRDGILDWLCLPQILVKILVHSSPKFIFDTCKLMNIELRVCSQIHLSILKHFKVLPPTVMSCHFISFPDAMLLCKSVLQNEPPWLAPGLPEQMAVRHERFGGLSGQCIPHMYTNPQAICIMCYKCCKWLSPTQFVCHSHNFAMRSVVSDIDEWQPYLLLVHNMNPLFRYLLREMKTRFARVPEPYSLVLQEMEMFGKCKVCREFKNRILVEISDYSCKNIPSDSCSAPFIHVQGFTRGIWSESASQAQNRWENKAETDSDVPRNLPFSLNTELRTKNPSINETGERVSGYISASNTSARMPEHSDKPATGIKPVLDSGNQEDFHPVTSDTLGNPYQGSTEFITSDVGRTEFSKLPGETANVRYTSKSKTKASLKQDPKSESKFTSSTHMLTRGTSKFSGVKNPQNSDKSKILKSNSVASKRDSLMEYEYKIYKRLSEMTKIFAQTARLQIFHLLDFIVLNYHIVISNLAHIKILSEVKAEKENLEHVKEVQEIRRSMKEIEEGPSNSSFVNFPSAVVDENLEFSRERKMLKIPHHDIQQIKENILCDPEVSDNLYYLASGKMQCSNKQTNAELLIPLIAEEKSESQPQRNMVLTQANGQKSGLLRSPEDRKGIADHYYTVKDINIETCQTNATELKPCYFTSEFVLPSNNSSYETFEVECRSENEETLLVRKEVLKSVLDCRVFQTFSTALEKHLNSYHNETSVKSEILCLVREANTWFDWCLKQTAIEMYIYEMEWIDFEAQKLSYISELQCAYQNKKVEKWLNETHSIFFGNS